MFRTQHLWLFVFAALTLAAPAAHAEVLIEGEPGVSVHMGERAGQLVLMQNGSSIRTLDVPLNWHAEGTWESTWDRALGGKKVWILRQTPPDKPAHVWIFGGEGDARTIPLIWKGRADGVGESSVVLVGHNDDNFVTLTRHERPALLPAACELLTKPWTVTEYDFAKATFTTIQPQNPSKPVQLTSLGRPDPVAWSELLTRASHDQAALWLTPEGLRVDAAKVLRDGREETSLPAPTGPVTLFIQPHTLTKPTALLFAPAAKDMTVTLRWGPDDNQVGTAFLGADPRSTVGLGDPTPACIAIQWDKGALSEVALLTELDAKPLAESLAALVTESLSDGVTSERSAAIAKVLAAHQEAVVGLLQKTLNKSSTSDQLTKAFTLANRLPTESGLQIISALTTHPNAPPALVAEALTKLSKHPKAAAAALFKRLQSLPRTDPEYVSAAILMAKLPVAGAINPLLSLIDQAADPAQQAQFLAALAEAGPQIAPALIKFIPAEGMKDTTRAALLRALLRVAPEAFLVAKHKAPEGTDALIPLLEHADIRVRLLTAKVLGAFAFSAATDALRARATKSEDDIERAEALHALASISAASSKTLDDALLSAALEDPAPTVRIAAAQILASAPYRDAAKPKLQKILDRETWPEARAAALLGLCAAGDAIALAKAAGWLDSPDAAPALREASAAALIAQPSTLTADLDRLTTWLEDSTLERPLRTSLLNAVATQPDTTAWLNARVERETALYTEDPQRGGRLLVPTLLALRASGADPTTLSTAMLKSLNAAQEPALALAIIDLLSLVDHPNVRARLAHERDRENSVLSPAAIRSLQRLDGLQPLDDSDNDFPDLP